MTIPMEARRVWDQHRPDRLIGFACPYCGGRDIRLVEWLNERWCSVTVQSHYPDMDPEVTLAIERPEEESVETSEFRCYVCRRQVKLTGFEANPRSPLGYIILEGGNGG